MMTNHPPEGIAIGSCIGPEDLDMTKRLIEKLERVKDRLAELNNSLSFRLITLTHPEEEDVPKNPIDAKRTDSDMVQAERVLAIEILDIEEQVCRLENLAERIVT